MSANSRNKATNNILLQMHPLQRILLSLAVSAIVFLFIRENHLSALLTVTILWIAFAFTFIITSWIIFFNMPVAAIEERANKEDGSRLFVMISILVSAFASMFTLLLLIISKKNAPEQETIILVISVTGMMLSWIMVHTIFTFHYAHLYYFKQANDSQAAEGLNFPGKQKPSYLDFAYFAFVIGMTFQVSDVEVTSPGIRRIVLVHGLLSFALNTFVVSLTINLIAGLNK
jgi:uncharacterized membrane protein